MEPEEEGEKPEETPVDIGLINYLIDGLPADSLNKKREALRVEVSELEKKQKWLSILDSYFKKNPLPPPPPVGPVEKVGESIMGEPTDGKTGESDPPVDDSLTRAKESPTETSPKKRTRKDRGTIEERNDFAVSQIKKADDWIYVDEFEGLFGQTNWMHDGDDVKEVTRGFLRQALEQNSLIEKTVYRIAANKRVVTARMYGIPQFIEVENEAAYQAKLQDRAQELVLFLTEKEAQKTKNANGDQMTLESN